MASPPHPYKLTVEEYLAQFKNPHHRNAKKGAEKYRLGAMQTRVMKAYHNAAKSATKKSHGLKSLFIYPKSMIKSMLKKTHYKKGGKSRRSTRRTRRHTRRQ